VPAGDITYLRFAFDCQLDQVEADRPLDDGIVAAHWMTLDELNADSAKINALLTAIDNASSLANLKTAVLAIKDLPTRTAAQVKTAIRNKLGV